MIGPKDFIDQFNGLLGADDGNFVDCNKIQTFPNITFTFNKANFTLRPTHYIDVFHINDEYYCVSPFFPGSSDRWSLGAFFMETVYTIFVKKSSFAKNPLIALCELPEALQPQLGKNMKAVLGL